MLSYQKIWQGPTGGAAPDEYAIMLDGVRVGTMFKTTGRRGGPWHVYAGYGEHRHKIGSHYGQSATGALAILGAYLGIEATA